MKVTSVESKNTKEKKRPAHVMPVNEHVIAPRAIMTYQHYDVKNITGLDAVYDYVREGCCRISCFRDENLNEYTVAEAKEMVYGYMKDRGIIHETSAPSGNMLPEHYFWNPDGLAKLPNTKLH